jgi:hypothetical protein
VFSAMQRSQVANKPGSTDTHNVAAVDPQDLKADLEMVQGTWVRNMPSSNAPGSVRAVKKIDGTRETVTYYGSEGEILREHQVDIKLGREGGVNVFHYSNGEVTGGGARGQTFGGSSYIYTVAEDTFVELQGLQFGHRISPAMSILVWRKASAEGSSTAHEAQRIMQESAAESRVAEQTASGI